MRVRVSCRALLACLCLCTTTSVARSQHAVKNSSLVHELRRQLMANNYDYMPSESEEPLLSPSTLLNAQDSTAAPTSTPAPAPAPAPAPTDTPAPPDIERDSTRPALYPIDNKYNDNKKEYDSLDIHNNINMERDKSEGEFDDRKKGFNDVDKYYTDLKLKDDDNEQQHKKINAPYDRDLPNREYETDFLHNSSDKLQDDSNPLLQDDDDDDDDDDDMHARHGRDSGTDIQLTYKKRKSKYRKHIDNKKMKEKHEKHHKKDNGENRGKLNYLSGNKRKVDVNKPVGYVKRADDGDDGDGKSRDVNISTVATVTPNVTTRLEQRLGFIPRAHDDDSRGDISRSRISKEHAVHKADLLYYMTDERLKQAEENYLDLSNAAEPLSSSSSSSSSSGSGSISGSSHEDYYDQTAPTTVKYNVFTVVSEGGGRRAGAGSGTGTGTGTGTARTFVREQRPGEVVVLRLDDKPFPQFRLPAARRQYMHSSQ